MSDAPLAAVAARAAPRRAHRGRQERLALALARAAPVEIVSVDSAQVYRGLDIGSAKPSVAVRAELPHHLVDICEPNESYSAGRFVRDALAAIATIHARRRIPLLVGGTMLYLRALVHGLAPLPQATPALRAALDARAAREGWPALHAELAALDPAAAARIASGDRQRIQRALEVSLECRTPDLAVAARHGEPARRLAGALLGARPGAARRAARAARAAS